MADEIRNCGDLDERLTPFVDDEATPPLRAAVVSHLAKCPPCREHADAERAARDVVREHRSALCAPAPAALRARCEAAASLAAKASPSFGQPGRSARAWAPVLRKWAPLSIAATLVLAVLGVFVLGLNNPVEALAATLTADHVKCFAVGDVHAHADSVVEARNWQQAQGWPVAVPPDAADQQLQLVDVRRCLSSNGRAAHMMYRWHGEPLSLYVMPADTRRDQIVRKMGYDAVIWCANQRTYAVVADAHSGDLTRVVTYLKANTK